MSSGFPVVHSVPSSRRHLSLCAGILRCSPRCLSAISLFQDLETVWLSTSTSSTSSSPNPSPLSSDLDPFFFLACLDSEDFLLSVTVSINLRKKPATACIATTIDIICSTRFTAQVKHIDISVLRTWLYSYKSETSTADERDSTNLRACIW